MTDMLSRRAVLTGTLQAPDRAAAPHDQHISSAVISVLPARRQEIIAQLEALPGAEIHHSSASKLVIVLEGPGSGELGSMLAEIASWPGVLSANMVFEQRLEDGESR